MNFDSLKNDFEKAKEALNKAEGEIENLANKAGISLPDLKDKAEAFVKDQVAQGKNLNKEEFFAKLKETAGDAWEQSKGAAEKAWQQASDKLGQK